MGDTAMADATAAASTAAKAKKVAAAEAKKVAAAAKGVAELNRVRKAACRAALERLTPRDRAAVMRAQQYFSDAVAPAGFGLLSFLELVMQLVQHGFLDADADGAADGSAGTTPLGDTSG